MNTMKLTTTLLRLSLIASLISFLLIPEAIASPLVHGVMLAQSTFESSIGEFLVALQLLLFVCGCISIGYGGYLVAESRPHPGLLSILGGFIMCAAVAIVRYFAQSVGGPSF